MQRWSGGNWAFHRVLLQPRQLGEFTRAGGLIACRSGRSLGYGVGEAKMPIMQMQIPVSGFTRREAEGR